MLGLGLMISACNKDKGSKECVWLMETSSMTASVCKMSSPTAWEDCATLTATDSLSWSQLQMGLIFDASYLQNESCSTPHDSLTGRIAGLDLIGLDDYNSTYTAGENLNSIAQVRVQLPGGFYSTPVSLTDWLATTPICTMQIRLYLAEAPDHAAPQHFRLVYRESDGTTYTVDTPAVLLKP